MASLSTFKIRFHIVGDGYTIRLGGWSPPLPLCMSFTSKRQDHKWPDFMAAKLIQRLYMKVKQSARLLQFILSVATENERSKKFREEAGKMPFSYTVKAVLLYTSDAAGDPFRTCAGGLHSNEDKETDHARCRGESHLG